MQDDRAPSLVAWATRSATEIIPDGNFFQVLVILANALLVGDQRLLPGGIDHDPGRDLPRRAVGLLHLDPTGHPIPHDHPQHASLVHALGSLLCSVLKEHPVEFRPLHLPGPGAFTWIMLLEKERAGFLAGAADKLHACFLHVVTLLHPVKHAEPLEAPVGFRHQRFADMKTGNRLAFQKQGLVASLGNQCRGGGTGRSTPDHNTIIMLRLNRHRAVSLGCYRSSGTGAMISSNSTTGSPLQ